MCCSDNCFSCVFHSHQMSISFSSATIALLCLVHLSVLCHCYSDYEEDYDDDLGILLEPPPVEPEKNITFAFHEDDPVFLKIVKEDLQDYFNIRLGPHVQKFTKYFKSYDTRVSRVALYTINYYLGDILFLETVCSLDQWTLAEFNSWDCPAPLPEVNRLYWIMLIKILMRLSLPLYHCFRESSDANTCYFRSMECYVFYPLNTCSWTGRPYCMNVNGLQIDKLHHMIAMKSQFYRGKRIHSQLDSSESDGPLAHFTRNVTVTSKGAFCPLDSIHLFH